MKKLSLLLISTALSMSSIAMQAATILQGAPAYIQTQVDAIEAQGFVVSEWRVTMLGRYKIEFTNPTDNTEREVVLSSTDGSILRDHSRPAKPEDGSNGHGHEPVDTNGDGVIDAADHPDHENDGHHGPGGEPVDTNGDGVIDATDHPDHENDGHHDGTEAGDRPEDGDHPRGDDNGGHGGGDHGGGGHGGGGHEGNDH